MIKFLAKQLGGIKYLGLAGACLLVAVWKLKWILVLVVAGFVIYLKIMKSGKGDK